MNIDRVRGYIYDLEHFLLIKRAELERYEQEYYDKINKYQDINFMNYVKELFKLGLFLGGYDKFENGEVLDEIDNFLASVIS